MARRFGEVFGDGREFLVDVQLVREENVFEELWVQEDVDGSSESIVDGDIKTRVDMFCGVVAISVVKEIRFLFGLDAEFKRPIVVEVNFVPQLFELSLPLVHNFSRTIDKDIVS